MRMMRRRTNCVACEKGDDDDDCNLRNFTTAICGILCGCGCGRWGIDSRIDSARAECCPNPIRVCVRGGGLRREGDALEPRGVSQGRRAHVEPGGSVTFLGGLLLTLDLGPSLYSSHILYGDKMHEMKYISIGVARPAHRAHRSRTPPRVLRGELGHADAGRRGPTRACSACSACPAACSRPAAIIRIAAQQAAPRAARAGRRDVARATTP